MEQDAGAIMSDEDKFITVLQEELWQVQVQWQWMHETLDRSSHVLQIDAPQKNHKMTQKSFLQYSSVVSPEHNNITEKFKLPDRQSSRCKEFLEGEEDLRKSSACLKTEASCQEVAATHVKSTLLEFIEILTEAVDYTAQITLAEFLSLRDHAEEIANVRMEGMNLNNINWQKEKQSVPIKEVNDPEITCMSCKHKFKETLHQNAHNKHTVHVEMKSKNQLILKPSTDFSPSVHSALLPPDDYLRQTELTDKEEKHGFDKDEPHLSSIPVRIQDTAEKTHINDELASQKRKLVLLSNATTNPSFHDQKRAHLESNPQSEENLLAQKIFAQERCSCTTCERMAKGKRPLCVYDCEFANINEICFELERSSRIMVISHREVLGAVHLLRRVPPKKWMTWLESLMHFISRSLESCSTFLALCWYAYDILPSINKRQIKRLLFLMNKYLSEGSIASDSALVASVKLTDETNTHNAEPKSHAFKKTLTLNIENRSFQQEKNVLNPACETCKTTSGEYACLDTIHPKIDNSGGTEALAPLASKGDTQQEAETDLHNLLPSNVKNESKKGYVRNEKLTPLLSKEIEPELCSWKALRESFELCQAPVRMRENNRPKMNFFARDALRFRQTHHLGLLFTSAINTVHKMGKDLALILQKVHECSENASMLCNEYQPHTDGITFKNATLCPESEESEPEMYLQEQENSQTLVRSIKNTNCSCRFREKNYPYYRAHRQIIRSDDHETNVRCTGHDGPIRGVGNSRHPGFLPRTSRSCSRYQKIQRRSRHHPYFPQGCFLMTESEHWSVTRKLSKEETCLSTTIEEEKCIDHGNTEDISASVQYFAEQTRCSDNSNSSTLPQSSLSENESVLPFDVESSNTTEKSNSSSVLVRDYHPRVREQAACLQRTTKMSNQKKGYGQTITSTLEKECKQLKSYKNAENRVQQKCEVSFDSSTDDSYVQQNQCLHSRRNAQLQLMETDSEITEDDYPEPLRWLDSETEHTMSPFCGTLYPPNSWQTLVDEGESLIEEWQQLLPQLMRGSFLTDLRKMENPEMQRVDSVILDLLASIGSCLRHVVQEIETHQQLWQSKLEYNTQEFVKPKTSPKIGNNEAPQNPPTSIIGHFQISEQLSSPDSKQGLSRKEVNPPPQGVNSERIHVMNWKKEDTENAILQHNSCNKFITSHEMCAVHASTPVPKIRNNTSLCKENPKPNCDVNRRSSFPVWSTDINTVHLKDLNTSGMKKLQNYIKFSEDSFTDTASPNVDDTSMTNISVEANMGTSMTPNVTIMPLSKAMPCATYCGTPGTEEKHGLATADSLLTSHRKVFLQMLLISRLEDQSMLRKLMEELCDGLEAAVEQSKLLVAARRKHFPVISKSNKRQLHKIPSNVPYQQQRTEYWQKIISSFFDSPDKTHGIATVIQDSSNHQVEAEIQQQHQKKGLPRSQPQKGGKEHEISQATLQVLEKKHRESMMSLERAIMDILTMASSHPEVSHDAQEKVSLVCLQPITAPRGSTNVNRSDETPTSISEYVGTTADSSNDQFILEGHDSIKRNALLGVLADEFQEKSVSDEHVLHKIKTNAGNNLQTENNTSLINENNPGLKEDDKEGTCTVLKPTTEKSDERESFKLSTTPMHLASTECKSGKHNSVDETGELKLRLEMEGSQKETNYDEIDHASSSVEEEIETRYKQDSQADNQDLEIMEKVTLSIEQASHLISYNHASALATAHLLACLLLY